jgi:hypothetical protein
MLLQRATGSDACRCRLSVAGNPRGIAVDGPEARGIPALAAPRAQPRGASLECLVRQRRMCPLTERTRDRRRALWFDIEHRGDVRC